MAKFSIMLFGIDSYTKENMYLPYKLEAKNANAAVREAMFLSEKEGAVVKDGYGASWVRI